MCREQTHSYLSLPGEFFRDVELPVKNYTNVTAILNSIVLKRGRGGGFVIKVLQYVTNSYVLLKGFYLNSVVSHKVMPRTSRKSYAC